MKFIIILIFATLMNANGKVDDYLDETSHREYAEVRKLKSRTELEAFICKKRNDSQRYETELINMVSKMPIDYDKVYATRIVWEFSRKEMKQGIIKFNKMTKEDFDFKKCK